MKFCLLAPVVFAPPLLEGFSTLKSRVPVVRFFRYFIVSLLSFITSGIRALFQICFQIRVLDGIDEVRSTGAGLQDEIFVMVGQDACDPHTVQ